MADPAPTDVDAPAEPEPDEGTTPDTGDDKKPDAPEASGQKTYSEPYVRSLRKEASGYRTRLAELEEKLQEFEDRDKSEQEKLASKLASVETRAAEAETRLLRFEVANEHGLDLAAAGFLTGTTREEIEHRASELVKLLKDKGKQSAGFDGGARQPVAEKGPPEQEHNDFLMRALGRAPSRGT
jgi:hypothetical protein